MNNVLKFVLPLRKLSIHFVTIKK